MSKIQGLSHEIQAMRMFQAQPGAGAVGSSHVIVKFEIIDRIRNCHLYGPPLEDNHKRLSLLRNRPSTLEIDAIFRLD